LKGFRAEAQMNCVAQIDTLHSCFRLVEGYEFEHSMRFDVVTRIRPDSAFIHPMPALCSLDYTHFSYLPASYYLDHLGIFGRNQSDSLFKAVERFYHCHRDEPDQELDWTANGAADIQKHILLQEPFRSRIKELNMSIILLRADPDDQKRVCKVSCLKPFDTSKT
jgi:hypothetical protein